MVSEIGRFFNILTASTQAIQFSTDFPSLGSEGLEFGTHACFPSLISQSQCTVTFQRGYLGESTRMGLPQLGEKRAPHTCAMDHSRTCAGDHSTCTETNRTCGCHLTRAEGVGCRHVMPPFTSAGSGSSGVCGDLRQYSLTRWCRIGTGWVIDLKPGSHSHSLEWKSVRLELDGMPTK